MERRHPCRHNVCSVARVGQRNLDWNLRRHGEHYTRTRKERRDKDKDCRQVASGPVRAWNAGTLAGIILVALPVPGKRIWIRIFADTANTTPRQEKKEGIKTKTAGRGASGPVRTWNAGTLAGIIFVALPVPGKRIWIRIFADTANSTPGQGKERRDKDKDCRQGCQRSGKSMERRHPCRHNVCSVARAGQANLD